MNEITFIPIPEQLCKALLKENNRLELIKSTTNHPYIKQVCKYRQEIIFELLNGRQRGE